MDDDRRTNCKQPTMLTHLRIENFALIDSLELDFSGGLNVLIGETGAGKSIILDALDAVLGGKVSGNAVRTGTQRALIEATFDSNETLADWLTSQEIDGLEEGIVITREVDGKMIIVLAHGATLPRLRRVRYVRLLVLKSGAYLPDLGCEKKYT
jgi:DNA repair ATPase RecN